MCIFMCFSFIGKRFMTISMLMERYARIKGRNNGSEKIEIRGSRRETSAECTILVENEALMPDIDDYRMFFAKSQIYA